MESQDVDVGRAVMACTRRAAALTREVKEELRTAGNFKDNGERVRPEFSEPLRHKVHPEMRVRVEGCIKTLTSSVAAAWEDPSAFELRQLKLAIVTLQGGQRMLRFCDDLTDVVGTKEADRLIRQTLP